MEEIVELSRIARLNRPEASGETHRASTHTAPADSPINVMVSGSPPKLAMFWRTYSSALIWSSKPKLPAVPSSSIISSVARKPKTPRR